MVQEVQLALVAPYTCMDRTHHHPVPMEAGLSIVVGVEEPPGAHQQIAGVVEVVELVKEGALLAEQPLVVKEVAQT